VNPETLKKRRNNCMSETDLFMKPPYSSDLILNDEGGKSSIFGKSHASVIK